MESMVIYRSQTGNTKWIAEAAGHCEMVTLQDADVGKLTGYDLLGLGGPVFVYL